jgi:DNA-binding GntR family transcriptional regulator
VAPIEISAVRDAQFVRELLECHAVAEAATSSYPDKEQRLHQFLEEQSRLIARNDHIGFFLSDEAMHRCLMEIAGHPHVWDMIVSAKVSLDRLRYLSLERPDWLDMIFHQHEKLIGCVIGGDPEGATALMKAHLRTAFAAIERIAAENADFFADATDPTALSKLKKS